MKVDEEKLRLFARYIGEKLEEAPEAKYDRGDLLENVGHEFANLIREVAYTFPYEEEVANAAANVAAWAMLCADKFGGLE